VNTRPLVCALALLIAGSAAGPANGAARAISKSTRHLAFIATLAPDVVTPGTKLSLTVDVRPKKGMHVYAPGTTYRPVVIAIEANSALQIHETIYPPPTSYHFRPLNEDVLVYEKPFRLTLEITPGWTPLQREILRTQDRLTIKGQLTYQACDDNVCFLPASVPFEWGVRIAR
jgi:DsbC/DsbD-like thiol-disulfide interchange protein